MKKIKPHGKAYFFDLDGTIYLDGQKISGSVETITKLQQQADVYVVSNNTSKTPKMIQEALEKIGLNIPLEKIINPLLPAAEELKKKYGKKHQAYLLLNQATKEYLQEKGIQHNEKEAKYVLLGYHNEITYQELQTACELIQKGIPYYITHIDNSYPGKNGKIPDCGAFQKLIETTTNEKPVTSYGKPSPALITYLKNITKGQERTCIGDMLTTDIALGRDLGAETVLVLSGKTKLKELETLEPKPTYIAETVASHFKLHPEE